MASPLTLQASLRPPTWFTGQRAQSRSNSQDQFHPRCLRNAVYPVYPSSFLAPKSSQVAGFKVDHSTDGEEGLSAGSLDPRETSANDMLPEQDKGDWYLVKCSRAGFVALAAAALCYSGPALAYKGGGPYGIQVTRGQDLSGQDFSGKTLIKQDFKTSILRQANFKGAKLLGASFFDADLTGADLSDSDLRGADFSLAQVQKANLSNAVLEGALVTGNTSFKNSNITGADFTDVYWREDQKSYLCQVASGVNPVTGNATRETLLCDD